MWHGDVSNNSEVESSEGRQTRSQKVRSSSPPLEGGESLCEFFEETVSKTKTDIGDSNQDANRLSRVDSLSSNAKDSLPSRNLLSLHSQELLPTNNFTQNFLQSILSSVDSHDPVVANAWMETLLDVIDVLPKDIVKSEILTLAVNKAQMSHAVSSRLMSCRLLGKLCTKFDAYIIKKEVLPVVLSLSQDIEYEVRACMCRHLDVVAKGVGLETTKSAILPELVELSNDEESFVRFASIEVVVQMLPILDNETKSLTIVPLVQKFCENSFHSEDSTLLAVAKQMGRLSHGLADNLSPDQKLWFLHYFRDLAQLGLMQHKRNSQGFFSPMPDLVPELENKEKLTECRWACAYNFPAMVLFAGESYFCTELHETFTNLCCDPFLNVRKTMAAGFCEVVKFLDVYSPVLLPDLCCLLNDNSLEVLKGIIPCLPEILKYIFRSHSKVVDVKESHRNDLVQAIVSCEVTTSISSNWRLHAELLTQFSNLATCMPPDIIYTQFMPLLLVKLYSTRPLPCRAACAYSLLVLLKHTPRLEQRNGIIEKVINDLCYGRSCHKRMLFFTVCDLALGLFSKSFFKRHFFEHVLTLCDDFVPNIRLRLCATLPKLKCLLKLPKDGALLQCLESCVCKLMTDEKDRDVIAAVNKAIEQLDKIEVPTEPASRRISMNFDGNFEDLMKENEENKLTYLELGLGSFSVPTTPAKSAIKNGKIPLRKSGTLPKTSKAKKFESNTLSRASTQSNIAKKFTKRYESESISSPKSSFKPNSNKKKEITAPNTVRKITPSPTKFLSSRPSTPARSQIASKTWQNQIPSVKSITDGIALLQISTQEDTDISIENKMIEKATELRQMSNRAASVKRRSIAEIIKPGTPVPSPEVNRRIPSRIPTPSSKPSN